ncbi:MAG TPA: hypothetical protein VLG39_07000 [Nitrospirota bacterium]|nr:hypothetical protein [Nitrospirota bacterium]
MADHIRLVMDVDMIMPVPLHIKRLRSRGINQALLLTRGMSDRHRVPLSYDNMARVRPTRPQVELTGDERIKNKKGAFSLRRPAEVEAMHIVLEGDVFTTGATMQECAAVLKKAGAVRVAALKPARAI